MDDGNQEEKSPQGALINVYIQKNVNIFCQLQMATALVLMQSISVIMPNVFWVKALVIFEQLFIESHVKQLILLNGFEFQQLIFGRVVFSHRFIICNYLSVLPFKGTAHPQINLLGSSDLSTQELPVSVFILVRWCFVVFSKLIGVNKDHI